MKRVEIFGSQGTLKRTAEVAEGQSCTGSIQRSQFDKYKRRDDGDEVNSVDVDLSAATRFYNSYDNDRGHFTSETVRKGRGLGIGSSQKESLSVPRMAQREGASTPLGAPTKQRQTGEPRIVQREATSTLLGAPTKQRQTGKPRIAQKEATSTLLGAPTKQKLTDTVTPPVDARTRLHYEDVVKENKQIREQLKLLVETANMSLKAQKPEIPDFCKWEYVKPRLTKVVGKLLLGSESFCDLYPVEKTVVDAILGSFDISEDDEQNVDLFYKAWGSTKGNNLRTKVMENIRNRRGEFTRQLREEVYFQLGHPKPRCTSSEEEEQAWLRILRHLHANDGWRKHLNADKTEDPWGSNAVYKAVARVWRGTTYKGQDVLHLTVQQAGFCFTVLDLAMKGQKLSDFSAKIQMRLMSNMEKSILSQKDLLKKFRIIC